MPVATLVLVVLLLPVAAGLAATVLPAFGYLPALGGNSFSLEPWRELLAWPGLATSLRLTLTTGIAATFLSTTGALAIAIVARRSRVLAMVQAGLSPVLATPHVALAIGFAFLVSPSGWIARLVSPWLSGWTVPPDVATVQDPYGAALVFGLCLKEIPYLLLMTLAALAQSDARLSQRSAAALGYGPWRGWIFGVLPRVWPQIRLPVMAVMAFSLSVVDVSLVLGPANPPTLAVQILRWFSDPDLSRWFVASAGAMLLTAIVGAALAALRIGEWLMRIIGTAWLRTGARGGNGTLSDGLALAATTAIGLVTAASLAVIAIWSITAQWRFPSALPQQWSVSTWRAQAPELLQPAWTTLLLGIVATLAALVLAVAGLESARGRPRMRGTSLLYVPLLVPQIGFLFGMQVALARVGLDGGLFALLWSHVLFVLPYVMLSLVDPWRALDVRLLRTAACLGASPLRVLWRVTLPLLTRPLLAASAVGFATSAGLYLPTLFAGGGRFDTLTTEAVTLSSGADRRILAATALLQAVLPLVGFGLAVGWPALRARRRRDLGVTA